MYTGDNQKIDGKDFSFGLNLYGEDFQFVPESVVNRGIVSGDKQIWFGSVLEPSFQEKFSPYSNPFSVQNIAEVFPNSKFLKDYEKSGFADERGYLVPYSLAKELFDNYSYYPVNEVTKEGFVYGPITGLATNEQGVKYYNVAASGKEGATAWIAPGSDRAQGQYVIPGKKPKWYEDPLAIAGLALIGFGGAGLLGYGPLAGGTAAAGTGAAAGGIVGTPGVSTIFPVAAPIAPTVTAIAPTTAAATSLGILEGVTFPKTGLSVPSISSAEVALVPQGTALAGQGLQVPTLPGLSAMGGGTGLAVGLPGGTVTQLGFVPTGATPVLGDPKSFINNPNVLGNTVFSTDYLAAPGAAAGISATDALRLMNQAQGLLGAGQNPIVPQQQGLPQGGGQARGVDYSGLLSLLQLQAGVPGVAPFTTPAQLRQMYQTSLLPNTLSLLG